MDVLSDAEETERLQHTLRVTLTSRVIVAIRVVRLAIVELDSEMVEGMGGCGAVKVKPAPFIKVPA